MDGDEDEARRASQLARVPMIVSAMALAVAVLGPVPADRLGPTQRASATSATMM